MIRILTVAYVVFALGAGAFAQCEVPHYRQGGTLFDSKAEVVTNISIRLQDFAPNKLLCLAKSLKGRYNGRKSITVSIFSSHEAARYSTGLLPPEPTKIDHEMFAQLHGYYVYDAEKHDDYIVLMPDPMIGDPSAPTNTKIDLAESTVPVCKLRVNNRCLLAFDHIDLPSNEKPATVIVTGRIERSGVVSAVRLADADLNSSGQERDLEDFAVRNLKSWRFERGGQTDALRIAYSVQRLDAPLEHGVNPEFMLPDKVNIQVGPILVPAHPSASTTTQREEHIIAPH